MYNTKSFPINDHTDQNISEWLNEQGKNFDIVGYQVVQGADTEHLYIEPVLIITIKFK